MIMLRNPMINFKAVSKKNKKSYHTPSGMVREEVHTRFV